MNAAEKPWSSLQFGAGPRVCLGKNVSYLEIYKLVPSMLRKYEVSDVQSLRERKCRWAKWLICIMQISFADSAQQDWSVKNRWLAHQFNFNVKLRQRVVD